MPSDLKPIVIFGASSFASTYWYYLSHDSQRIVSAFTIDAKHLCKDLHEGLPVVPFEELSSLYPPTDFDLIIAAGFGNSNALRAARFEAGKKMGYHFASYVSRRANVSGNTTLGEGCFICDNVSISPFCELGDNVTLRTGSIIGHHSHIGRHSFIGGGSLTGGNVHIGDRCTTGLGSIIRDGIHMAERSMLGAGAVLTKDTEIDGLYIGIPARKAETASPGGD